MRLKLTYHVRQYTEADVHWSVAHGVMLLAAGHAGSEEQALEEMMHWTQKHLKLALALSRNHDQAEVVAKVERDKVLEQVKADVGLGRRR